MYKVVLIDDEPACTEILALMIKRFHPDFEVKAIANDAVDGVMAILENEPDLIFMDIEMPKMSGFDVLNKVKNLKHQVIFTTAFNQYAVEAFKFHTIDYLLKPIDEEKLKTALDKFKSMVQAEFNFNSKFEQLMLQMQVIKPLQHTNTKLPIPTVDGLVFILIDDIVRCEAEGNYTNIIVKDKQKILSSKTLKEYDEQLSPFSFHRVHQSHLININYIARYVRGDGGYIVMDDGSNINVSRNKKDSFLEAIKL